MGEVDSSVTKIEKLFHEWLVKGAILVSLSLQLLLLFLAPFRKRTSNYFVQTLVYGVYKLSSLVANAAFALTAGAQWVTPGPMLPFGLWGAFTLLHLAGHECLTAYTLEDCDAWLTTFLTILAQYFFHFLIGMSQGHHFPLLTAIIFSVSLIRLLARTLRLRFGMLEMAGFTNLPDPYPLILNDGEQLSLSSSSTDTLQTVLDARCLLRSSLRLIAGIQHGLGRRNPDSFQTIRSHFLEMEDPKQMVRIVEVELNFIYDSFYTDGIIRKHLGRNHHLIYVSLGCYASLCSVIALISFIISHESENYSGAYYNVTCILLWGTLIHEFLSYFTTILSDWTIASLGREYGGHILLLASPSRWRCWYDKDAVGAMSWMRYAARVTFRRWSETISTFSFLAYSVLSRLLKPVSYIRPDELTGVAGAIRSFRFVSNEWYTDELGSFLVEVLRMNPMNKISCLRRDWGEDSSFKRSVLAWHIATDVLYEFEKEQSKDCHHSKLLSDYMAYLVFMKPRFFSNLRGNPLVGVEATREYVRRIMYHRFRGQDSKVYVRTCCQHILKHQNCDDETEILKDVYCKLDGFYSVEDAALRWRTMSQKWVEIVLYAASECDPLEHLRGVSLGGELVTLVWVLAFHLGFF